MRIILGLIFLWGGYAYAGDMSLLPIASKAKVNKIPKTVTPSTVETVDKAGQDEFLKKEEQSMEEIKLLNLDVEKAGLELKKREFQSKAAALTRATGNIPLRTSTDAQADPKPVLRVLSLMIAPGLKQAVIQSGGTDYTLREGEEFSAGMVLRTISPDKVLVQYSNGKKEAIAFNGA